jgi:hypothetical protein
VTLTTVRPSAAIRHRRLACLLVAMCIAAIPASAQITHNAPSKYGTTFYFFDHYASLPSTTVYPPTLTWNLHDQNWWNMIVQRARDAHVGWFAVNAWGQSPAGGADGADPGGIDSTDGQPYMSKLITAINSASSTTLKLALFDDTTSEVLRKNNDKGRGWLLPGQGACPSDPASVCRFDISPSGNDPGGEGGWFYFYDQQWKRFFNNVPDQYRFKINGRPVVFMWLGGYEWYTNQSSFSNMIAALKAATLADFGFTPYVIVEKSWTELDPDASVDAAYHWFNPDFNSTETMFTYNGVTIGHVIPGYQYPGRPVIDRQGGALYDSNLNVVSGADLVLIESINNVDENAHIIDTTTWSDRELATTLRYAVNHP